MKILKSTTLALLLVALPFAPVTEASGRDHSRGGYESGHDRHDNGRRHDRHQGHGHGYGHWQHPHHRQHPHYGHHYGRGHDDHRFRVVLPLPPLPPLPPVILLPGKHHH